MNLFENLQKINEKIEIPGESYILDIVKNGFETGDMPYDDFNEFSTDDNLQAFENPKVQLIDMWEFYNELVNMGPARFYDEYYDELEFSDDFKSKYANKSIHENTEETIDDEDVQENLVNVSKDDELVNDNDKSLKENLENSISSLQTKADKFGAMIDVLGEEMSAYEVNEFLKGLTDELGMDVYEDGEPYPTDLDGYFGQPIDELDFNDETDAELFNWVDSVLTDCITKTKTFIEGKIETLKGEISSLETTIKDLEGAFTI